MTDEEMIAAMKAEVAEARRILAEDGVHVRLSKIEEKLGKHFPDEPEPDDPDAPKPPPKKDEPGTPAGERKRERWWPAGTFDEPAGGTDG